MSSTLPLNYAPRPPLHRRQSLFWWIGALSVFIAAATTRWWLPPTHRRIEMIYWQQRCLNYSAPVNQLIFDSTGSTQIVPREWAQFYAAFSPPGCFSQGTIFLHRMKTPHGHKRLVAIDYTPWLFGGTVQISRVFISGSLFQRPREFTTRGALAGTSVTELKVFAGQIDPADPSHFSFRAQIVGGNVIYDGWLQDNDTVVIGPRK